MKAVVILPYCVCTCHSALSLSFYDQVFSRDVYTLAECCVAVVIQKLFLYTEYVACSVGSRHNTWICHQDWECQSVCTCRLWS